MVENGLVSHEARPASRVIARDEYGVTSGERYFQTFGQMSELNHEMAEKVIALEPSELALIDRDRDQDNEQTMSH